MIVFFVNDRLAFGCKVRLIRHVEKLQQLGITHVLEAAVKTNVVGNLRDALAAEIDVVEYLVVRGVGFGEDSCRGMSEKKSTQDPGTKQRNPGHPAGMYRWEKSDPGPGYERSQGHPGVPPPRGFRRLKAVARRNTGKEGLAGDRDGT